MTVLLDTNIIMDALQERQPFDAPAKEIMKRSQEGDTICLFTANAATDIFYLYSMARGVKSARIALEFLLNQYSVISVAHEDCIKALSIPIDDFEDALVVACAQKANVEYVVTRDEKLLTCDLPIKVISPTKLLELIQIKKPKQ
jgi:predicted nucleic acid-binding protein